MLILWSWTTVYRTPELHLLFLKWVFLFYRLVYVYVCACVCVWLLSYPYKILGSSILFEGLVFFGFFWE